MLTQRASTATATAAQPSAIVVDAAAQQDLRAKHGNAENGEGNVAKAQVGFLLYFLRNYARNCLGSPSSSEPFIR